MPVVHLANAVRTDMMTAFAEAIDADTNPGEIRIYDGSMPANAETAISGQTLLATLTFSSPPQSGVSNGVLTFDDITEDSEADASGTATWARIVDGDGATIADVNVGTSDATLILNTTSIVQGGPVRITSGTMTLPSGVAS